jgi:integrase
MARTLHRLSSAKVKNAKPGMWCDGGGLYLQVTADAEGNLHRSWLFRFATGKVEISRSGNQRRVERQMGLGGLQTVSLAEAREKAAEARKQRERGIDPIEARNAHRTATALAEAKQMTFDQCRAAYIAAHRAGWRNLKHAAQWESTLETYASPIIGRFPVASIDTGLVLKVLEPIWASKPETASRLRGRIENILDWATVRGFRHGENPARWRGHLDKLLPSRAKVRAVKHHAALPFKEIADFIARLREHDATAVRALEFAILTAARTGEVLGARWDEIDLGGRVWTIPAGRMKGGREHRVPLSETAISILKKMWEVRQEGNPHVFAGERRPALSNMALLMLLRRMKRDDLTAHGFRSTFRDWAAECTNYSNELAEAALAHAVGSKVEAAYRRGDLFEKRLEMMDAWGRFCSEPDGCRATSRWKA